MIASGAPITEVQHRLGRANPAITLQVYSHFFTHGESAAADRLADFVLGNLGSPTGTKKSGPLVDTQRLQTVVDIPVSA